MENTRSQIFSVLIRKVDQMLCKLSAVGVICQFFFHNIHSSTSANGLLKTMHTGVDSYIKARAEGHVTLSKPHITFLAASNGVSLIQLHFSTSTIKSYFLYRILLLKLFDKS